jgi:hypothetical protein
MAIFDTLGIRNLYNVGVDAARGVDDPDYYKYQDAKAYQDKTLADNKNTARLARIRDALAHVNPDTPEHDALVNEYLDSMGLTPQAKAQFNQMRQASAAPQNTPQASFTVPAAPMAGQTNVPTFAPASPQPSIPTQLPGVMGAVMGEAARGTSRQTGRQSNFDIGPGWGQSEIQQLPSKGVLFKNDPGYVAPSRNVSSQLTSQPSRSQEEQNRIDISAGSVTSPEFFRPGRTQADIDKSAYKVTGTRDGSERTSAITGLPVSQSPEMTQYKPVAQSASFSVPAGPTVAPVPRAGIWNWSDNRSVPQYDLQDLGDRVGVFDRTTGEFKGYQPKGSAPITGNALSTATTADENRKATDERFGKTMTFKEEQQAALERDRNEKNKIANRKLTDMALIAAQKSRQFYDGVLSREKMTKDTLAASSQKSDMSNAVTLHDRKVDSLKTQIDELEKQLKVAYLKDSSGKEILEDGYPQRDGAKMAEIQTEIDAKVTAIDNEVKNLKQVMAGEQSQLSGKTIKTQQEFDSLPSGTVYTDGNDGKQYRKP